MNLINNLINKLFVNVEKLNFSWRVIVPTLFILCISCLTLKNTNPDIPFFISTFSKQLIWIVLGCMVFFMVKWFRVQFLLEYAYNLYLLIMILPFISIISAFDLTVFSIWMLIFSIVLYLHQPKIIYGSINFVINIFCGILSPFIWNNILYNHQRDRILTLLNPAHRK